MDESDVLKELRSLILSKLGIRNMTPADCKTISIEISKTLKKNVSETTIKRLFGFAMVRHNFSRFTITTLLEYVNNESLIPNIEVLNTQADSKEQIWEELEVKARRITDFTIKSIKNRSGIPYEMTVGRKFSEHDFEDFYNSDHSFMSFISQPGYGKTIILSHLAEKILSNRIIENKGATLAFITAYHLLNKDNTLVNFEAQIKSLLGISTSESLTNYVTRNFRGRDGKLVIFLDGFSEVIMKRDTQNQIFGGIVDFLCSIEDSSRIKLVMNMRSTTWARFYDQIRGSSYLKRKWFQGNYFNLNDGSNVPPLTEKEVDFIVKKIDQTAYKNINPRLKSQLKFPFHIQLYYQLKEEDPDFNYSTNITFYELISRFIQDKIYKSNYYTEKILFLKKVIQLTDYGKKQNAVSKDDLISELAAFKNAYSDLLSDGILMEERSMESFHPKEYVRFIHPHIFEYFLFIELLEKFQLRLNGGFFNYIEKEYVSSHSRFHILQWTIRFMIRTRNFDSFDKIFQLCLTRYEKNYLILFISENLDYYEKSNQEKLSDQHSALLHEVLVNELTTFDFSDSCYKEALESLVKVVTMEKYLLVYCSLLSIQYILELNASGLRDMEKIMSRLKPINWDINPVFLINIAIAKIDDEGENDQIYVDQLYKMISSKPINTLANSDAISTILFSHCALFLNDSKAVLTLFDKLSTRFRNFLDNDSPFSNLYLKLSALAQEIHTSKFKDMDDTSSCSTQYIEAIGNLKKAYQLFHRGERSQSVELVNDCLVFFKKHTLNFNSLLAYDLLIKNLRALADTVKHNETMYEMLCFAEDKKISTKLIGTATSFNQARR